MSAFDCTGTPSTGSAVFAAVMPGRWAAPPAPAMMTSRPRPRRGPGVLEQQIRRAMRGDDAGLVGDAEAVERVGGVLSVSQSEVDPMMMPTSGFIGALYSS